ncbi:MAG: L-threonylcarbamoyladenylate synthase [Verrucomicrobiota bacterium]
MQRLDGQQQEDLQTAARLLQAGELVAIPTETVYGLAANGLDSAAVQRIFAAKGRPAHNPLILHVASMEAAQKLAHFTPQAERLAEAYWPGPLTLVLERRAGVPDAVTAGQSTVALRMPAHPVAARLLGLLDFPLAAPSANRSGLVSPTRAAHVEADYAGSDAVAAVLDGGACTQGVESTILHCRRDGRIAMLRSGPLDAAAILEATGLVIQSPESAPMVPGSFRRHYSPQKPSRAFDRTEADPERLADPAQGWLFFSEADHAACSTKPTGLVEILSPAGEGSEAAAALYNKLRQLDSSPARELNLQWIPDEVGHWAGVLNDRIGRAIAS